MYYQKILLHSRDKVKLDKIRERLRSSGGGIYKGIIPSKEWFSTNIGEGYERVILASDGIESLSFRDFTVLGGWCAIRTNDMLNINEGKLSNLERNTTYNYSSPSEVSEWVLNAVSIDQIVEAVGTYKGCKYTVISEQRLWGDRLQQSVEAHLGRSLTNVESEQLKSAVVNSELKRKIITQKYLDKVTGQKNSLKVVIDTDIFEDLVRERNILLEKVSVTMKDLAMPIYLNRVKSGADHHDVENILEQNIMKDLVSYIDSYSLVWFMYTGPYLELLKSKGYVDTEKAVIIEPWSHASSNESESLFNQRVFEQFGINNYLDPNGFNRNLGFIAMDEVASFSWKKIRSSEPISKVPNLKNYKNYTATLSRSATRGELDLSKNQIFLDAVNYYPFNENLQLIKKMIEVREDWLNLKSTLFDKDISNRKQDFRVKMKSLEDLVIDQLRDFFDCIFD